MRPVALYEAKYTNLVGYWMSFNEVAMQLLHEALTAHEEDAAFRYDVRAMVRVRYALRVIGLGTELYKMAAEDPSTAKMLLPGLERRQDMTAEDDIVEVMEKLDTHLTTQLIKEVATLKTSNAGKKNNWHGVRGGASDAH